MTDNSNKHVASRRKLLKALASSGAVAGAVQLPKSWNRPVIDSAMLPAHAQTTSEEPGGGGGGQLRKFYGRLPISGSNGAALEKSGSEGLAGILGDLVVPEAGAAEIPRNLILQVCMQETSPNVFNAVMKVIDNFICPDNINNGEFSAFFSGPAGGALTGVRCDGGTFPGSLNYSPSGANMNVNGNAGPFNFSGTIFPGGSTPSPSPCIECPPSQDGLEF